MWLSTLVAMDTELVSDSLVYRYNPSASPDGLRGSEGTFTLCSFWYVDALARSGYLEEAQLTFEKMLTYANHLGLYAEEIGLTGEQLGNFPQAFSHLSLINAAVNLDYQLDHGSGCRSGIPSADAPDDASAGDDDGDDGRDARERRSDVAETDPTERCAGGLRDHRRPRTGDDVPLAVPARAPWTARLPDRGVAVDDWTIDQLVERARTSIVATGERSTRRSSAASPLA